MTLEFRERRDYLSWGRVERRPQQVARPASRRDLAPLASGGGPRLAVGLLRSYGDSCLATGASLLDLTRLDHLIAFDDETGLLTAEAGVSLGELMRIFVPRGWFPPVTPGTRFVTLGGAVANDVHGKNHEAAGTFGRHVAALTLLRSDVGEVTCSPAENAELFAATIGGLGLTGVITTVTLRMRRIASAYIDAEKLAYGSLDAFFELNAESEARFEHLVAWFDCTAGTANLGRGIFSRGNWSPFGELEPHRDAGLLQLPVELPSFTINPLSLRLINAAYRANETRALGAHRLHYGPFFHPLDSVRGWSRIYGRAGMYQYQCVLPVPTAAAATHALLAQIAKSGEGSFLAVLKAFGALPSPGLLSFPMPGITLAVDFANHGRKTLALFERLDQVVSEAGGRLYPAKDGRISREMFAEGYPGLARFARSVDPACTSDFWERVRP